MEKEGIPEDNIMAQSGDIHSRDIKQLINSGPAQKSSNFIWGTLMLLFK